MIMASVQEGGGGGGGSFISHLVTVFGVLGGTTPTLALNKGQLWLNCPSS